MIQEISYSLRRLRHAPGYAMTSALLIAISLAACAVVFGLVDTLLLRSLPVRDPGSLVQLFEIRPNIPPQEGFSQRVLDRVTEESTTLIDIIGESEFSTSLELTDGAVQVGASLITANYFEALGVGPLIGRVPVPAVGENSDHGIWLSHAAWTQYFARDARILGTTIRLGGFPFEVAGVLPEEFTGTNRDDGPDFRVLSSHRSQFVQSPASFGVSFTKIIGRVRPGESLASAAAETEALWTNMRADFIAGGGSVGPFDRNLSVELRSISRGTSRVREQFSSTLLLLFAGASILLVMVSLNVGGMMLARMLRFRQDSAVRLAIGATRIRVIRIWLIEAVLLSGVGGVAGLVIAAFALPILSNWLAPVIGFASIGVSPSLSVSLDYRVAAYGLVAMLLVVSVATVVPLAWSARDDAWLTLKSMPDDRANRRLQSGLSVVQIAIATILLLGGGLMLRTLDSINEVDTGFERESLIRFAFELQSEDYDAAAAQTFRQRLAEASEGLPGVESAAFTVTPVMQGIGTVMVVSRPGQVVADGAWNTNVNRVSPGYFETMGIDVIRGETFATASGPEGNVEPVVVNQAFVSQFFGAEDPVGTFLDVGTEFVEPAFRIVGVVKDANYRSLREFSPPMFYTNHFGRAGPTVLNFHLILRAADPAGIVDPLRALVRTIDPSIPILEAVTMSEEVRRSLWRERLVATLAAGFAAIGLAIATIGLYAVLAQFVTSRRREIGLRLALGAGRLDVGRLVGRHVGIVLLFGVCAGVIVHLGLGRWLSSLLFGVTLLDPVSVICVGAILMLTTLVAGYEPLRRAVRIDPARTLREE